MTPKRHNPAPGGRTCGPATWLQTRACTMAGDQDRTTPGRCDDGRIGDRQVPWRDRERDDHLLRRLECGRDARRDRAELAAARGWRRRDTRRVREVVR